MTATKTLHFDGYTLEPASFEHRELAQTWTAQDLDHAGCVDPRFWLEQDEARDSYLVSDTAGPVLFFKVIVFSLVTTDREKSDFPVMMKAAEAHMQFMPTRRQADHVRIADALVQGCPWLERILAAAGITEIYFDSASPGLVAFTTKRMGFTQDGGRLRKRLTASAVP